MRALTSRFENEGRCRLVCLLVQAWRRVEGIETSATRAGTAEMQSYVPGVERAVPVMT